jgi:hypothetical protein
VPATARIVRLSMDGITAPGVGLINRLAGLAALAIVAASGVFVLRGLVLSVWRLGRLLMTPAAEPAGPA